MKRDILCISCGRKERIRCGDLEPYTGEFLKFMIGFSTKDMQCDFCGAEIEPGNIVVALSIYTTTQPYTPWESDYMMDAVEYSREEASWAGRK